MDWHLAARHTTQKNISSSHWKPRYSHTLVPSRHCKLRRMNLIAFYVCENKQLNIFQFLQEGSPTTRSIWRQNVCVVVLCLGHRRELLGFPCKQKKRILGAYVRGNFGLFQASAPWRLRRIFALFLRFCYSNQPHNVNSQLPRTVYAVCASMCWMKEKKQRWICILYDFSTSASHHGKHAHYICTFFPHFFFGAKRQSLRYMDIMLCSREALGDSQVCHTLLGQSLAQRWEICFELQDFRISENYYYLFHERVRQTVSSEARREKRRSGQDVSCSGTEIFAGNSFGSGVGERERWGWLWFCCADGEITLRLRSLPPRSPSKI